MVVWPYARRELRRRAGSLVLLTLLVAVAAGVTMAGVTGARRTSSALTRLRTASVAADVLVQYPIDTHGGPGAASGVAEELRRLPGVRDVGEVRIVFLFFDDGDFDSSDIGFGNLSTVSVDGRYGRDLERGRLLAGVRPDPTDPLSVSVSETFAQRHDLQPGDAVPIVSLAAGQLECIFSGCPIDRPEGPRLTLRVAAVERFVVEALAPANPQQLLLTPAFVERYGADIAGFGAMYSVRLQDGLDGIDRLTRQVVALAEGNGDDPAEVYVTGALDDAAGLVDASRAMAVGIVVFAAIAGVAGLAMVAQSVARHIASGAADRDILRAVGCTGRQRALASLLVVTPAALLGCVAAVSLALALSPRFPLGQARRAEPAPGVAVDVPVLAAGSAAVIALVCGAGLLAVRVASRRARPTLPSRASRFVTATPPTVGAGIRAGVLPGGRAGLQGVGSAVVAVIVVVGALVFASSLDRFVASPARDGWSWDMEVSVGDDLDDDDARAVAREIAADHGVGSVLLTRLVDVPLGDDESVLAVGSEPVEGTLGLTVVAGRGPSGPGEVALGARTARALGVSVGDEVDLDRREGAGRGHRVVGLARFPVIEGDAPDEGAWFTLDELAVVAPDAGGFPTVLADVAPGADADAVVARLRADHAFIDAQARRSSDTNNLAQMGGLPGAVAGVAALLGTFALAQTLVTGVRRRRSELAVLRVIGFTTRQVARTVAWQATAVAAVALGAGLPLGLAAGRSAWSALAHSMGAADDPLTPAMAWLVAPVVLAIANVIALGPARVARRAAPVDGLRSE